MEPLFENSYQRTEQMNRQLARYVYRRPVWLVLDVAIAISVAVQILFLFFEPQSFSVQALILAALVYIAQGLGQYRWARLAIQRDREMSHGQPLNVEIQITADTLTMHSHLGNTVHLSLEDIHRVGQTRQLIVVESEGRILYPLRKDSFTRGTASECLAFLKQIGKDF